MPSTFNSTPEYVTRGKTKIIIFFFPDFPLAPTETATSLHNTCMHNDLTISGSALSS